MFPIKHGSLDLTSATESPYRARAGALRQAICSSLLIPALPVPATDGGYSGQGLIQNCALPSGERLLFPMKWQFILGGTSTKSS